MHLVIWDILCRLKDRGGVGLKRAEAMNKALVAKLAWRLLTEEEALWSRLVRSKYGLSLAGLAYFKHKTRASIVWRGLEWASELLHSRLRWKVNNG